SRLPVLRDVQIPRRPRGKPPRHLVPRLDRLADPGIPLGVGTERGSRVGPGKRNRLRALHAPDLLGVPTERAEPSGKLPGNHVPDCVYRVVQPSWAILRGPGGPTLAQA